MTLFFCSNNLQEKKSKKILKNVVNRIFCRIFAVEVGKMLLMVVFCGFEGFL